MMNRTLQYFINIKFNSLINKTIAKQCKKNIAISSIKKQSNNKYNYYQVRKYTRPPLSFGNKNKSYSTPEPPNNNCWIIIAMICGSMFVLEKKK